MIGNFYGCRWKLKINLFAIIQPITPNIYFGNVVSISDLKPTISDMSVCVANHGYLIFAASNLSMLGTGWQTYKKLVGWTRRVEYTGGVFN